MALFRMARSQAGLGSTISTTRRKAPIRAVFLQSLLLVLLGAFVTFLDTKLPLDAIQRGLLSPAESSIVRDQCSASFRPRGKPEGGSRNEEDVESSKSASVFPGSGSKMTWNLIRAFTRRFQSLDKSEGGSHNEEEDVVSSTFLASFPGSGSKMTWNLIQALTGQDISSEYEMRDGLKDVVAIKTHTPHSHGMDINDLELKPWVAQVERAFLLLRHPLDAIPSFHNHRYEQERGLVQHSTRAPPEAWVRWRDDPGETYCVRNADHGYSDGRTVRAYDASEAPKGVAWDWRQCAKTCGADAECESWNLRITHNEADGPNECRLMAEKGSFHLHQGYVSGKKHPDCLFQSKFEEQLRLWERFVEFWMEWYRLENRFVVSYEDITHDEQGPEAAKALASFLFEAEGVHMVEESDVTCVWESVVKYNSKWSEGKEIVVDPHSLRSGSKKRPYTKEQLSATKMMLESLQKRYTNEGKLVLILDAYLRVVDEKIHSLSMIDDHSIDVETAH